jgi:class 3 adenylate cyclase
MKPPIEFIKRQDGVRLAYSVFGEGLPLVVPAPWVTNLVHSFEDPFILNFWMELSQEFKIVLYDKHGCGQSDRNRKEFNLETELKDLESIIDNLGLKDIILFGTSMAGPVTIVYALRNQENVKRLIIYGSYANGNNLAKKEVQSAIISLVQASWGLGSRALADLFIPNATSENIQQFTKFQRESASAEVATNLLKLNYALDITDVLGKVHIPTLILHRKKDKAVLLQNGKELAYNIPNAKLKILGGTIHFPFYEEPGEIITEIFDFLDIKRNGFVDERQIFADGQKDNVEQLTIVFTDIVSSTKLITRTGDSAARDFFLTHDKIIRSQVKRYRGRELQNLGDGFMLAFISASSAIKCACEIQKKMSETLSILDIRIGINTGEVVIREGKHPFGQAIVIASRIVDRCKGGQVLVSDLTKQLVAGSKFSFSSSDNFVPKGFDDNLIVHEVNISQ